MPVAKLGAYSTCTSADLASATSEVNAFTDGRLGSTSKGKFAGREVLVRTGDVCIMYIALGPNPTDKWTRVDGGVVITPA
jgi:hypothetical protein